MFSLVIQARDQDWSNEIRVKRQFRLRRSTDFMRVRRYGKSYAHPLVVLVVQANQTGEIHIGVTAGRSFKSAVKRNRAKRLMRQAIAEYLPQIEPGCDIILIARTPILNSHITQLSAGVQQLLQRAKLFRSLENAA